MFTNTGTIYQYAILATLGNYTLSGNVEAPVNKLNEILTNAGVAVGSILIALALIKIIIAIAGEDSKGKMDSGMLFGAGIVFVSISSVLKLLNIKQTTTGQQMAANIISLIGKALTYVGVIILLFAILSLIIAIAQENSDSYVSASKLIMVSIGMLAGDALLGSVKMLVLKGSTSASLWVKAILSPISKIASYGALGLVTCGVFKIVMGLRTEDDRDRNTGIRFLMTGIALASIRAIFHLFGLDTY